MHAREISARPRVAEKLAGPFEQVTVCLDGTREFVPVDEDAVHPVLNLRRLTILKLGHPCWRNTSWMIVISKGRNARRFVSQQILLGVRPVPDARLYPGFSGYEGIDIQQRVTEGCLVNCLDRRRPYGSLSSHAMGCPRPGKLSQNPRPLCGAFSVYLSSPSQTTGFSITRRMS